MRRVNVKLIHKRKNDNEIIRINFKKIGVSFNIK